MTQSARYLVTFGGSGFLGRHVVRALANRGYRIRVAVRRPELAGHLQPIGRVGQIHAVQANLRYPHSVEAGAARRRHCRSTWSASCSSAASSASSDARRRRRSGGAGGECRTARASSTSPRSAPTPIRPRVMRDRKRKASGCVLAAAPTATIMRPSIVFGPEDDFFNRFASLARMAPALPLIGGGHTRFQPVFAGDVGEAIARCGRRRAPSRARSTNWAGRTCRRSAN